MNKYQQVTATLKQEIPQEFLAYRKQGGTELTYIPWHYAANILDEVCERFEVNWEWRIDSVQEISGKCVVIGTLYIDQVSRSATGIEEADGVKYGDPTSNASSMAFRRAAALHGLGRYLYDKKAAPATKGTPANAYEAAPVTYKPRGPFKSKINYGEEQ